MGTRGAVGFRFQETDKLQYNHWDSYPSGLGVDVVELIQRFNDEQLTDVKAAMTLIEESADPEEEQ